MTERAIYFRLTDLFRELFADDSIVLRPETTAADIAGWDSPMHLDIIAAVEARFGIKIQSREIERLGNVGDFVQLILAKAIPMK